ncbi:MAG TPA: tRNA (adenosine(37)-N6)-threonylcarbamoyltransferase complex dimerization subunit type 1 TsaB [Candidatus Saccharimonadales bacterium]|nr:tRNA (adenosine(37)-N6)-threonylcarbamoyltransferase complex dimerization subunit type 1 TsaB [Candidatus Saccharimonadales bacterium]
MIILTIRTDKLEAEIGLYDGQAQLAYEVWTAHRALAETLHRKIETLLKGQHKSWADVQGLACYQGPGSFTGLRIGLTVANALAYSYDLPVVATQDPNWLETGIGRLEKGETDKLALPFYGAEAHVTPPKK